MNDLWANLDCDPKELEGIDPAAAVHLCIDVQRGYFTEANEKDRTVATRIANVAPLFNKVGLAKTIWVYHSVTDNRWYVVSPGPGDKILPKKEYSAFNGTGLDEFLKENQIKTVFLSGGYTSCCINRTAGDAVKNGYEVVVLSDCIRGAETDNASFIKEKFTFSANGAKKQTLFTSSDVLLKQLNSRKDQRALAAA